MQIKNIALFAATAAALPQKRAIEPPCGDDKFTLIAIRSGSSLQFQGVTAWKGNFLIGGQQNATCDAPGSDVATFYIQDGEAFLYATSATPQQLYVDRSGMGQGKIGYTTGAQPIPRNAEQKGFSVDESGYFVFNGSSPVACPTGLATGGYSFWFYDSENPAGNQNCTGVGLAAVKTDSPVSCLYSE